MIAGDLLWFFVMSSVWGKSVDNQYWKGQSSLQTLALILCWVQIGLKAFISYYLYLSFIDKEGSLAELTNFNYKSSTKNETNKEMEEKMDNPY